VRALDSDGGLGPARVVVDRHEIRGVSGLEAAGLDPSAF
jgi:hypothetical protein